MLATGLTACQSLEEIQNEIKATGMPVITSIVPSTARVGDVITLRGLNFGTATGKVGFQDVNANISTADITAWADDFIVVKVPPIPGDPTTSVVHVLTADQKSLALKPSLNLTK